MILIWYCGNNFSAVKDSKGLDQYLKEQMVGPDATVLYFDVRALYTSIPVKVTLESINRKFTEHINWLGIKNFLEHTSFVPKAISLLELVLNSCVFSVHGKFYQQLQGAAIGSSVSPVIAKLHMDYFEGIAPGPLTPHV